jgi:hypothetical protein
LLEVSHDLWLTPVSTIITQTLTTPGLELHNNIIKGGFANKPLMAISKQRSRAQNKSKPTEDQTAIGGQYANGKAKVEDKTRDEDNRTIGL